MSATEPAFPCEVGGYDESGNVKGRQTSCASGIAIGLTKREWFAGMALQGLLSTMTLSTAETDAEYVADVAVQLADAMLKRLERDSECQTS